MVRKQLPPCKDTYVSLSDLWVRVVWLTAMLPQLTR